MGVDHQGNYNEVDVSVLDVKAFYSKDSLIY